MAVYLFLFAAFAAAAYTDAKSGEIPIWLFPSSAAISIIVMYASGHALRPENLAAMLLMAVPVGLLCILGKSGGGDLIMFSVTGLLLGSETFMFLITFCAVLTACFFISGRKNRRLPMAPPAFVAYIIFVIWRCCL